jgi:hypothetical protein
MFPGLLKRHVKVKVNTAFLKELANFLAVKAANTNAYYSWS